MNDSAIINNQNTKGKVVNHLGLVAATIKHLKLIEAIDKELPLNKEKGVKVTHGQCVAAMILNGLGFNNQRLYMFPEFLANKPVTRLLGEDLRPEYFNDDALGRTLDAIFAANVTSLFSKLAFKIARKGNLLSKFVHFDTTTLSVYGDYEKPENLKNKPPKITYGHSKAHRRDLKQVVLNLATTGKASFPIWMEAQSGNVSDKKVLCEAAKRMQTFSQQLKDAPSFIYVADSAMYANCINKGGILRWLSRVPNNFKWAKQLLEQEDSTYKWLELEGAYRIAVVEKTCNGVKQRLGIVSSPEAYKRENKAFDKQLAKKRKELEKKLWHLSNQVFDCKADAETSLKIFNKKLRFHQAEAKIEAVKQHLSKGRPKKNVTPKTVGYQIVGNLIERSEIIEKTRIGKGRFLLATNEFCRETLPDEALLAKYKAQSKTERGFRFIKDDSFEVDSIFLKKSSRIAALMMIMTLCLMIYNLAEYYLRKSCEGVSLNEIDPYNKLYKSLTIKRVFKLFEGVHELTIDWGTYKQCLIINLDTLLRRIITFYGKEAMKIYEVCN